MYYYIKGILVQTAVNFAVLDCHGVGYKIYTSAETLRSLPNAGSEVLLYTYLYVREDTQDLYGFFTPEEQGLFLELLSVSGVGPKAALSILSVTTPASFALAVITNQIKVITKASGVGPKLAQRIILELRDKMKNVEILTGDAPEIADSAAHSEAVSALIVLGYSAQAAENAVSGISGEQKTEDIVREALKKLMK